MYMYYLLYPLIMNHYDHGRLSIFPLICRMANVWVILTCASFGSTKKKEFNTCKSIVNRKKMQNDKKRLVTISISKVFFYFLFFFKYS